MLIAYLAIPPESERVQLFVVDKVGENDYQNWVEIADYGEDYPDARTLAYAEDALHGIGFTLQTAWENDIECLTATIREYRD